MTTKKVASAVTMTASVSSQLEIVSQTGYVNR
jgi:hypothetical protein